MSDNNNDNQQKHIPFNYPTEEEYNDNAEHDYWGFCNHMGYEPSRDTQNGIRNSELEKYWKLLGIEV